MSQYDFLIVGGGLYGLTVAREAADRGASCLVLERRPFVGGNCVSEFCYGIEVHNYGPHIFHSANPETWAFAERFGAFDSYVHTAKARSDGKTYTWPINLLTLERLFAEGRAYMRGYMSPSDGAMQLFGLKQPSPGDSFEDHCLRTIGPQLYRKFFSRFTRRFWGRDPKDLPASIAKRIPVRLTYEDSYFLDGERAGIPSKGWTAWIMALAGAQNISIEYTSDAGFDLDAQRFYRGGLTNCRHIIFTGSLDELFEYKFGVLPYRSLTFHRWIEDGDALGAGWISYADGQGEFTRVTEYKFLNRRYRHNPKTVVVGECPTEHRPGKNEPLYPIPTKENLALHARYLAEAAKIPNFHVGGRLGLYRYLNMDTTIELARAQARKLMGVEDESLLGGTR